GEHIELAKYVLPARANGGIPAKRYSPKRISKGSKYPMANIAVGNLSKEAKAFTSNSDHTLFLKHKGNFVTCLIIYVDDMIIIGNDEEEIKKLKGELFTEFEMKDLGRLKYFLGIEVLRSQAGIFICQKKYILDLLAKTGMLDCKPAETPMMSNKKLYIETEAELADRDRYQRLVGKLLYLSHTRLDIAYAVGVAGDKGNRRSTSRYFSLVGDNLVTWKSKKQKVVSLSSAEAEFRGISRGLAEVLWIRKLTEVGFPPKEATQVMCDNEAAIQISKNPVQHDRTKHVEIDWHFIKEKLEVGIIKIPFVKSKDQLADILTKAVGSTIFNKCLDKLNFGNPTIQLKGSVKSSKGSEYIISRNRRLQVIKLWKMWRVVWSVSGSRKIVATAMPCATSSVVLNQRGIKRKIGCIDVATQMGRKNKIVDDYIRVIVSGSGNLGRFGCVGVGLEAWILRVRRWSKGKKTVHTEVEIMQHLSGHHGVVTLNAVYEEPELFHLVMELCSGGRLIDQITNGG
nr:putative reverse transcriptase, RNA-dependent DNA polymerase [Tanacetum cinerariifolium]